MTPEVPNDCILVQHARLAVSAELQKKRALKQPIAKFDPKSGQVYLENGDGTTVQMGNAMQRGRYSERAR
jgi:hypothetical protein